VTVPRPSNNDPFPRERKGDSSFLPVVIAAGVALLAILAIAVLILHNKGTKLTPKTPDPHHTSLSQPPGWSPVATALIARHS
jgi:hypothetical protein